MSDKSGGPAFWSPGLTVRDVFALGAMVAGWKEQVCRRIDPEGGGYIETQDGAKARRAYEMADAMLQERERGK